jgi:hypothetical protein
MSEPRLEVLCGIEWGKGAQTPPPRPTPPPRSKGRRLTQVRFVNDDKYSPASLRSDGDRHRLES